QVARLRTETITQLQPCIRQSRHSPCNPPNGNLLSYFPVDSQRLCETDHFLSGFYPEPFIYRQHRKARKIETKGLFSFRQVLQASSLQREGWSHGSMVGMNTKIAQNPTPLVSIGTA